LAYDIFDNSAELLESTSFTIFPAFPIVNLDILPMIIIILSSGVVGAVIGVTFLKSKKSSSSRSEEFLNSLKQKIHVKMSGKKKAQDLEGVGPLKFNQKLTKDIILDSGTEVNSLGKYYSIGLISLIGGVALAFLLGWILPTYEISTLILIGMIFLSLYVFVVWLYRDTTLDIRKEDLNIGRSAIGYLNTLVILIIVVLMLQIGANVPWIRYYIVEQSGIPPFVIGPFSIPNVYLKIFSIGLSSLVAFTLSVYFDIRKNLKDIDIYEKQNANFTTILYTKEEFIKKTTGRINIKVLVFLVLLGFALIPYSADGFANILPIGLLLICPCVIVFLVFFLVGFIGSTNDVSRPFLLETVKTCGNCNTQNINSAIFCSNCMTRIVSDQILIDETAECQSCSAIIAKGSKFCMSCGETVKILEKK